MNLSKLNRIQRHAIRSFVLTAAITGIILYAPFDLQNIILLKLSSSVNSIKQIYFSPKEPNKEIYLVTIDDKSLNDFGRWPWPRTLQGQLFDLLRESKVLAVDILYLEDDIEDTQFSRQLSGLPQLILSLADLPDSDAASMDMRKKISPFLIKDFTVSKNAKAEEQYVLLPEISQLSAFPEQLLPALSRSGLVHINHTQENQQLLYMPGMIDDSDGVVIPSLGLQVLQLLFQQNFSIELGRTNQFFIKGQDTPTFQLTDYSGIPLNFYSNSFNTISASELLSGATPPSSLNNKIVFVGYTATGLHDTFVTPLGPIKGVEVHSTFVSNFLNDEMIFKSEIVEITLLIILAFSAWIIVLLQPLSFSKRFLFFLSILVILFLLDFFLFKSYNLWLNTFFLTTTLLLCYIINEILWSIDQEYASGNLKRAFQSYLSEDLLNVIRQNPEKIHLGGRKQNATFLFSDLRNFSSLTEEIPSEVLVETLNRYFSHMTGSILQHKGMLDKYIGDAIMAIFNAPLEVPDHALQACLSALEMSDKLEKFNEKQKKLNLPQLNMGIGINTGEAVIGNIGSDIRFSYTAIGDTVNIASRIENITKQFQCEILIGESTWNAVRSTLLTRYIDTVTLKGKGLPTKIYQVLPKTKDNIDNCKIFQEARAQYSEGEIEKALNLFKYCEEQWQDPTAAVFSKRCEKWISEG